jgi:hypothetical protein
VHDRGVVRGRGVGAGFGLPDAPDDSAGPPARSSSSTPGQPVSPYGSTTRLAPLPSSATPSRPSGGRLPATASAAARGSSLAIQ